MASPKKDKKPSVSDKDHPSLIEVGGRIRLRVLEDFNIERDLPKWVRFREEWDKIKSTLGFRGVLTPNLEELTNKVKSLDKPEEEKAVILQQAKNLIAMDKAVQDDRWNIRGKHESEVNEAVLRQAKYVRSLTRWDKVKNIFRRRKTVPVEVAMDELMDHIELTSTPELAARLIRLKESEENMRKAGQYKKADVLKQLRTILAEEATVVAAGFERYVSEDTMIDFLRKSERGTMVDFLRYYEDEIPPDVVAKKVEADRLMVFDNYVVAYYSDVIAKAAAVERKAKDDEEKKQRVKRRDPILFGLIKNSRKLYYICDWTTDTDDLTLEKIEKELGVTCGSLVPGAETGAQATSAYTYESSTVTPEDARSRATVYSAAIQQLGRDPAIDDSYTYESWTAGRMMANTDSGTIRSAERGSE